MFQVTTLDLAKLPAPASPDLAVRARSTIGLDFFGKRASLTVSGQLEAEIFATSLGNCYTFGPTFRAENSNTTRHLAEFWMIEPEMPFYELPDNMQLAEDFIRTIVRDVLEHCPEDVAFFNERIEPTVLANLQEHRRQRFRPPALHRGGRHPRRAAKHSSSPSTWGRDLQSEHERYLTEKHFQRPVILFDYPRTIKPFYMKCNDDGKTVRAMDVLVPARRRNHRRQPARRTAGRARRTAQGVPPQPERLLVVPRPAPLRHACRTRASAWDWSGSCSSSPAWPTSAT